MAARDTDELYGLPLDRFIAERDALSRALRNDGQREQAAVVARLRKPSVAAWAVNQLARAQAEPMADLFAAGDELREVQSEVLAGRRDAPALRAAVEQERAAAEALIGLARGLLTSEGHELSPAVLDRVADTLNAAALDDDARAAVREGRLERELRHVGLGAGAPQPLRAPQQVVEKKGADERRQRTAPAEERADAKRAERERARARRAARIAEAEARREADRAGRALNIARERRDRAAQALSQADEALAQAEAEAEQAADAHRRAREELEGL